ncbi:hypothetical protein FXO38_23424 [Capsicum annuum]|nr:hypothetical protein FXO38_23424 [Capsicum annuum]KAF3661374.1 hypothetical protein FXO37_12957 [Capsicum annuum]
MAGEDITATDLRRYNRISPVTAIICRSNDTVSGYYTSDACTLCGVSKSSYSTNDVNLKKETLRIQPDEENPGKYLVAFDFDATVPGRLYLLASGFW